tara:strand:- start:13 stop:327 length:315 start_codon:yes stop_codon:yes gene_type:complete
MTKTPSEAITAIIAATLNVLVTYIITLIGTMEQISAGDSLFSNVVNLFRQHRQLIFVSSIFIFVIVYVSRKIEKTFTRKEKRVSFEKSMPTYKRAKDEKKTRSE